MTFSFWPVVRFVVFVLLLALPTCRWIHLSESIRDSYQVPPAPSQTQTAPTPPSDSAKPPSPVPDRMAEQNKQLIDWGVLLLGGLVALITTTKVHKISHAEWWYLILTPAASFIVGSLWVGVLFQRRAAYLVVQQTADTANSLYRFLSLQSTEFVYGLALLAVFAFVFLGGIILGRVNPCQDK